MSLLQWCNQNYCVPRRGVINSVTARKLLVGHINRQERKTFLSHFSYKSQEKKTVVKSLRAGTSQWYGTGGDNTSFSSRIHAPDYCSS
jgi:hypothetical protein